MGGSSKEVVEISLAKQSGKIIICTKEAMFAAWNFPTQSIRKEENATVAETPSLPILRPFPTSNLSVLLLTGKGSARNR